MKSAIKFTTLFLLFIAGLVFIAKQGWIPEGVIKGLEKAFRAPPVHTYYQWQDDSGNVIVTKEPPPDQRFYTEFKAAGEIKITATPSSRNSQKQQRAPLSTSDIEAFQLRKRRLIAIEVGTECRWLTGEIIDLERKIRETTPSKRNRVCLTMRQRLEQFSNQSCKNSEQEFNSLGC